MLLNGSERVVHEQGEVTFDEDGKPARMMGTVQDITGRKEAEEELRASQEELRHLSAQLLEAQERERKRVARELHDGLGQTLSAMKFRIENTIGALDPEEQAESADALKNLVSMAQRAVEEVRRISKNLWPSILDDLGLLPTISWFCREFGETHPHVRIEREMTVQEDERAGCPEDHHLSDLAGGDEQCREAQPGNRAFPFIERGGWAPAPHDP